LTIFGEHPVVAQKHNKKGKPTGKPVLTGFAFTFSAQLAPSSADNSANYQVGSTIIQRVKKKVQSILKPLAFTASYDAPSDSVTLTIAGPQSFPKGGQITVVGGPSGGVTGTSGARLAASEVFTIGANGRSIIPG
jgi:hypothetical protein